MNLPHLLCATLALLACTGLASATPMYQWVSAAGGPNTVAGAQVVADAAGNTYVAGDFEGTAAFGATNLTSSGGRDAFVAKLDPAGNVLWARRAGGSGHDFNSGVATDGNGNVYVTGGFTTNATFGSTTVSGAAGGDLFVAKYSASGALVWVRTAGSGSAGDFAYGYGIGVDAAGAVYIGGGFYGAVTWGSTALTSAGDYDILLAKLNADGSFAWGRRAGGTGYDAAYGLASDAQGNSSITGEFFSTSVAFGAFTISNNRFDDIFTARYDASGNALWAHASGGRGYDYGYRVAVDADGNTYMTGGFEGSANFGSVTLVSPSSSIAAVKYGPTGNVLWASRITEPGANSTAHINADVAGNAYVISTIDTPHRELFATKLDLAGAVLWSKQTGNGADGGIYGRSIAVDPRGSSYVLGEFVGGIIFDSMALSSVSLQDIAVAKLNNDNGVLEFAADSHVVYEDDGSATLTVLRSDGTTNAVSVAYGTANGSATSPTDFTARSGTLNFVPGQTSASITVPIQASATTESSESFTVALSNATNGALLGAPRVATVTILDGARPVRNAAFVSQNVPSQMIAGQVYRVGVAFRNSGNTTWRIADEYKLGSQDPENNVNWGYNRVILPEGVAVAPGQSYTFTFDLVAPESPGTYSFQWRMLQEGVAWFGELSPSLPISVVPAPGDAAFVSQTVPNDMLPGEIYDVAVTMRNTGSTTWRYADGYALGSEGPRDNMTWGFNRVGLAPGASVAPGQTYTFAFSVTAPSVQGSYNFEWAMLREGVAWFGSGSASLSIAVSPPCTLRLSSDGYAVSENGGVVSITVTRIGSASRSVSVQFATTGGTATSPSDYTATSGMLVLASGQTSGSFNVPIANDPNVEPDESFGVSLSAPSFGATLGTPAVATVVIGNDDEHAVVEFAAAIFSANENSSAVTIEVKRTVNLDVPISVGYATSNGTANAGSDYAATSGTLQFAAGQTSASFTVSLVNDSIVEPDENFSVALSSPSANCQLGQQNTASVAVLNDDAHAVLEFTAADHAVGEGVGSVTLVVERSVNTDVPVSVSYATSNGTAAAGSDFTSTVGTLAFAAGETSKSFSVPIINDSAIEQDELFVATLTDPSSNGMLGAQASAQVTIRDNDQSAVLQFATTAISVNEQAGTANLTLVRTGGTFGAVSVGYWTNGSSAVSGSDYPSVSTRITLADGQTSATIAIPLINDNISEPAEQFAVKLGSPTGATLGPQKIATVTLLDDDPAAGSIQFAPASYSVSEGAGSVTLTLARWGGSRGAVSVSYWTSGATAVSGSDYPSTSSSVSFADGQTTATVTIPLVNNATAEPDEHFQVKLGSPTGGAVLGVNKAATVNIADDDPPAGSLQFSASAVSVSEGAGSLVLTITRWGGSAGAVRVACWTNGGTAVSGSDYRSTSTWVDFAEGQRSATVTIPVINDTRQEPNESFTVKLGSPSGGAVVGARSVSTVTVTDDDQ